MSITLSTQDVAALAATFDGDRAEIGTMTHRELAAAWNILNWPGMAVTTPYQKGRDARNRELIQKRLLALGCPVKTGDRVAVAS
jgi:hypothetical protein